MSAGDIAPAAPTRSAIVSEARRWLGTPYLHQASLRGVGCDCLGLVRGVWRAFYGAEPETPPPYAPDWAEARGQEHFRDAARRHLREIAPEEAGAGDVLLFRFRPYAPARHCAILSGESLMIHAHDGAVVSEVALTRWWRRHAACAFAFPGRSTDC
ncbi:NlpC/P60 family protein [Camelimonas sp. ID_303_24]